MRILLAGALLSVPLLASPVLDRGDPTLRQELVIEGTVTDSATGTPLPGVQISIVGTGRGTLSDQNGRYRLAVPDALLGQRVAVRAALIGYENSQREVHISAGTTTVDFSLQQSFVALEEVVVTGKDAAEPGPDMPVMDEAARAAPEASYLRQSIAAAAPPPVAGGAYHLPPDWNTEEYDRIYENDFLAVALNPLSTFSIDVDRASYSNVRRFISQGQRPPKDAVRIEEMINYFHYRYPAPAGEHPFSVTTEVAPAPWNTLHRLVRIGLQGREIDMRNAPPSNLVFLIDVSGSMASPDKLPLLKSAFRLLVDELRPEDRVAIVVYAGAAGLVLPSTPGSDKEAILDAIERLESGGSTAGGAGIRLAYDVARQNHIEGGNNRVILATDGDFNTGVSSVGEMVRLIEEKREQGTFLTVLGFGTGNLNDAMMEQIADHGNGQYAYIDNLLEARKTLVGEMGGTLLTIAKDVKLQVEFNPARVQAYRLIGYENRLLRDEDFNDDTKDAGDLGAGHSVTALYEVIPAGVESDVEIRGVDPLRYQRPDPEPAPAPGSPELGYVKLRYKEPDGRTSRLLEHAILDGVGEPSADFRFAAAVAAFGMLLRDSEYKGDSTLDRVSALANRSLGEDENGYRAEFVRLVGMMQRIGLAEGEREVTVGW